MFDLRCRLTSDFDRLRICLANPITEQNLMRWSPGILSSVVLVAAVLALSPAANPQEKSEREFQECSDCPVMVGIPGGSFVMGSPDGEPGRFDTEGPLHRVSVRPFALGKYNVTGKEFLIFLKETGYQPAPCDPIQKLTWRSPGRGLAYPPYVGEPPLWPAVCLDWKDAQAYVAWLNAKVQRERPALAGRSGPYRLPSEAEWEYAARQATTARWWGDAIGIGNANCNGCGSQFDYRLLADVDSFALFVWAYGMQEMPAVDRRLLAGAISARRMTAARGQPGLRQTYHRGGSWTNVPIFVRSAARSGSGANGKEYDYSSLAGFRVARTLP